MRQLCLSNSGGEKWDHIYICYIYIYIYIYIFFFFFPEVGFKKRNHMRQIGVTRVLRDLGCCHSGKFSTQSCVFKLLFGGGFFFSNYLFIYFWLCWVFVSVRGLSLVAASGGHSSSRCAGLSLSRPLLSRSTSSRRAGSVVVAHGLSCSAACGIFPDQGSNLCPLHWQADSQLLLRQGSPRGWVYLADKRTCTFFYTSVV